MTKMKASNWRQKLKCKTKRKIRLKSPILDRQNLLARSRRAREEGEKKNEFVLGTEIIDLIVDLGAANDESAMMFSHLLKSE